MVRTKIKQLIAATSASVMLALGAGMGMAAAATEVVCPAGSHQQGNNCKVVICHRTNSVTNPYTTPDVDISAAGPNGLGDHLEEHLGPVFNPNTDYPTPHNGDQWGDIIPAIEGVTDGLNWTAEGQAVYNDGGCDGVYNPGGTGGEEPGNPQVLGDTAPQVTTTPTGSVAAGNGGAVELNAASVAGLTGSLAAVVTGVVFAAKRRIQL